ncbi:DNA-binding FadR family transcriptional regulator [Sagittula marina]|uniref:DNA-binding FadR family transcriptional regulator n=1 Tax=Sagittula marina TaxID=943940 RepID=A0A7W6GU99_9RHOB|nr:transcriptional regulator NanR [Sagittula marina]MBB3987273.1 DNA-binding FadR family transcriptional regulator [Sagittula marina]
MDSSAKPGHEKIVRRKLSEQVLERLHEMIRTHELKPGDYMPSERALMERFGVGRPAVREAMQSLHNSGLITISHGERSRVNELTAGSVLTQSDELARLLLDSAPANLDHLKHARQMFELGMVRVAAETATEADVADLRALIERQRNMLGDATAFIATDMAFHRKLAELANNPIILSVSDAMLGWLFEYHVSLLHRSGSEDVTLAEHAKIVDHIESHDVAGATEEMRRHLERSRVSFEPHGSPEDHSDA